MHPHHIPNLLRIRVGRNQIIFLKNHVASSEQILLIYEIKKAGVIEKYRLKEFRLNGGSDLKSYLQMRRLGPDALAVVTPTRV